MNSIRRVEFDSSERGMTLVELLAVIVLVGLLIAVVARNISGQSEAAKAQLNQIQMEKLRSYLSQYRLQFNVYPDKLDDLIHPNSDVKQSGKLFLPLAEEKDARDIWGGDLAYQVENNGRSYSLTSLGADGVAGGEGANQDLTMKP